MARKKKEEIEELKATENVDVTAKPEDEELNGLIELVDGYYIKVTGFQTYSVGKIINTVNNRTGANREVFTNDAHLGSLKSAIKWYMTECRANCLKKLEKITLQQAIEEIKKSDKIVVDMIRRVCEEEETIVNKAMDKKMNKKMNKLK